MTDITSTKILNLSLSKSHPHKVVTNITVPEVNLKTSLTCASNSSWIPLKIPRSWSFGPSNFLPMACAPTVYILPYFFALDCHLQTVDLLIGQFLKWYCLHQSAASFDTVISIAFSASSFKLNFPTEIKILYQGCSSPKLKRSYFGSKCIRVSQQKHQ